MCLRDSDCVIVPDLGGFMAHHIDARYDEQEQMFLPPLCTLGFNPQLKMNDSLLVQSYIEAYDISYPEAFRRIQSEVAELKQHLDTEGVFELNDLGVLSINEEGRLLFEPCEAGILTPALYGLSSFEIKPLKNKEIALESKADNLKDERTITIKMSWLRNLTAAAAAVVAFLMISSPISNSQMPPTIQQGAFISINTTQQPTNTDITNAAPQEEVAAEDTNTEEETLEPVIEDTIADDVPQYCIVMASQVSRRNAEDFINRLTKKGFNDAYILETKFRRVVYGKFTSIDEAQDELKNLRTQSNLFSDSWVMETK